MEIRKLKINGFGKLKDKDIELKEGINIIYGKNEAGKSTLLKFITGMFYGVSKNKNGGNIPEIDKVEPWDNEEFSGKINYVLDNKNEYEVYREFKKKNPKIFNSNLEDISKDFNIDKTKGNQFFYDQTGLDESTFITSVITKQGEVKLDDKSQNNIIQKISNILGTGEDTNSYSKIISKLKKKLNDEVGTSNTKEKPINTVEKRINELSIEKEKLEAYQSEQFEIEEEIRQIKLDIVDNKERLETLKTANIKLETIKSEEGKINVLKKLNEDTKLEIEQLKNESKEKINSLKTNKITLRDKIIISILIIISAIMFIFLRNKYIAILPTLISILYIIFIAIKINRNKSELKEERRKYKDKINEANSKAKAQIEEIKSIENDYNQKLNEIYKQYNIKENENVIQEINSLQSKINEKTLKLHTTEIDYNNINPKLEKLINIEEELESLLNDRKDLKQKSYEIKKAIETLEMAYNKMKEEITPKFTEKLSDTIKNVSNNKYNKVKINISGEIIVEDSNGNYINAENLSLGTIDQLYLALRLASIEEITEETMPIILDEAFAYYDNERLKNILEYMSKEYKNRQIIIFTCTDREKSILNSLEINYNLVTL